MSLEECLGRKYQLYRSENFDEVLKALGVDIPTRKIANTVSAVIELTRDGDTYILKSSSKFKNTFITFKLGEEFEEETPDGRKVKSTIIKDGNKLHHIQKGDKTTTIVREFTPDEVNITITVDDYVAKRNYKAI